MSCVKRYLLIQFAQALDCVLNVYVNGFHSFYGCICLLSPIINEHSIVVQAHFNEDKIRWLRWYSNQNTFDSHLDPALPFSLIKHLIGSYY